MHNDCVPTLCLAACCVLSRLFIDSVLSPAGFQRPPDGKIKQLNTGEKPLSAFFTEFGAKRIPVHFNNGHYGAAEFLGELWGDKHLAKQFGNEQMDIYLKVSQSVFTQSETSNAHE